MIDLLLSLVGAVVALCVYFLPAYNAARRRHPQDTAILLLTLLLGWTVLGWIAALIWSATVIEKRAGK